ncbi:MAG: DUF3185 domain-containing protein [Candidatus Acidiferrales bacterium]
MKPLSLAGLVLIVLGALALIYQGISYHSRKNVADVGSVHITHTEHKHIDIPPVVGGLILLGGIILVVAGSRQRS